MSTIEKITSEVSHLRPEEQAEVLDFVEFLKTKKAAREESDWKNRSLESAMRGMENEPDLYSTEDVREPIK